VPLSWKNQLRQEATHRVASIAHIDRSTAIIERALAGFTPVMILTMLKINSNPLKPASNHPSDV
jgi:hypothetical protein